MFREVSTPTPSTTRPQQIILAASSDPVVQEIGLELSIIRDMLKDVREIKRLLGITAALPLPKSDEGLVV